MEYIFSWGWFLFGLAFFLASIGLVIWYRPIADNFGGGVGSYDRFKFWGIIGCIIGFIFMLNLHTLLLRMIFSQFLGSSS